MEAIHGDLEELDLEEQNIGMEAIPGDLEMEAIHGDLEEQNIGMAAIHGDLEEQNIHSQASEPNRDINDINNPNHFDWDPIIVAFCLTSAVEIALQSQIKIPLLVYLLSLAMIIALASVFISSFLSPNYPNVARTLKHTAKLSAFAAFFLAITVAFPLPLKLISWSIFGLCLLVIAYAGGAVPRK